MNLQESTLMALESVREIKQSAALINEREAARLLGVKVATLRRWRFEKRSLPYVKVSRLIRYKISDIEAFISANREDPLQRLSSGLGQEVESR